ncbi:putative DNA repair exonuclease [Edwardsiella phage ETP-1]|uniref:Putative DNA repair exonuclease n=1 Tax=Edwardsiella phage ETP-1 TaxID=2544920 RepID=A0A6G5P4I8_9CAUD|nr:putative DNA repair exonuclease [Edwardsiella phage ETP-1]
MTKKYELLESDLTTPSGATLYRVKALKDFGDVKAGYIEGEHNLDHAGTCWVSGEAWVSGGARVS